MENQREYTCSVCGKNFDPTKVDHSSSWWKRSDGKRYEREKYCSVECIGYADANWRMSDDYLDEASDDYLDEASVEKNQKCSQDEYPNTAEIMLTASDVHPKLPSALVLITDGATQAEAARLVGLQQGNLSIYISQLRKLLKSNKLQQQ
jgi:DNA-directed RNA polymerase subunit RPC12/RpoP